MFVGEVISAGVQVHYWPLQAANQNSELSIGKDPEGDTRGDLRIKKNICHENNSEFGFHVLTWSE